MLAVPTWFSTLGNISGHSQAAWPLVIVLMGALSEPLYGPPTSVLQSWAATEGFVCRNLGSTALHLAMVASGVLAGAFAKRSKIWDIAAGWLLVSEAGGRITDIRGQDQLPFALDADPNRDLPFLAAPPEMHKYLLETVRAVVP